MQSARHPPPFSLHAPTHAEPMHSHLTPPQVKELIRAVRPEVVMVELCKDRVGLLVDDQVEKQATNLWHTRKVLIEGLPEDPAWPTADELKPLLQTRCGRPVTTQDIEADVYTLLSTGACSPCMEGGHRHGCREGLKEGVM